MSDRYQWWQNALEGRFGPVLETEAEVGFYRVKSAGDFWLPVAIWHDQMLWAHVGRGPAESEPDKIGDIWLRCAKHPVTEEDYRHCIETGRWLGEAPADREAIGGNFPPEGFDALVAKVKEQADEAAAWLKDRKIATQMEANRCETWANEFLALRKQAEAEHKTEKQPHIEAGREVDRKYKPLIDLASISARALKAAVTPYLNARLEEKRQAAAAAVARGDPAPVRSHMNATTSGASGRKLHLQIHHWAVITDWQAAMLHFAADRDIRELIQKRADKLAAIGAPVPWAEFKSEQRAA